MRKSIHSKSSTGYGAGIETCSCTISHLPCWRCKIAVQRKVAISRLPDFIVASCFTVAADQAQSLPQEWTSASLLTVKVADLYSANSFATPAWYSGQLEYFKGATSKKMCLPLA